VLEKGNQLSEGISRIDMEERRRINRKRIFPFTIGMTDSDKRKGNQSGEKFWSLVCLKKRPDYLQRKSEIKSAASGGKEKISSCVILIYRIKKKKLGERRDRVGGGKKKKSSREGGPVHRRNFRFQSGAMTSVHPGRGEGLGVVY